MTRLDDSISFRKCYWPDNSDWLYPLLCIWFHFLPKPSLILYIFKFCLCFKVTFRLSDYTRTLLTLGLAFLIFSFILYSFKLVLQTQIFLELFHIKIVSLCDAHSYFTRSVRSPNDNSCAVKVTTISERNRVITESYTLTANAICLNTYNAYYSAEDGLEKIFLPLCNDLIIWNLYNHPSNKQSCESSILFTYNRNIIQWRNYYVVTIQSTSNDIIGLLGLHSCFFTLSLLTRVASGPFVCFYCCLSQHALQTMNEA